MFSVYQETSLSNKDNIVYNTLLAFKSKIAAAKLINTGRLLVLS